MIDTECARVDDPDEIRRLAGLSPYHLIRDGVDYPAVFIDAGDTDPRCPRWHARKFAARVQATTGDSGGPSSLVFTGPNGATLRQGNFNKLVRWSTVVAEVGVPGLHFHDLRHTGNTLAADAGVSTRNLMAR